MKILLVYDSKFGNTEKIAQAMKDALAKMNDVTLLRAADAMNTDLTGFEFVIVGSPINGGRPSPLAKSFLENISAGALSGKKAAAFDTGTTPVGEGFIGRTAIRLFGSAAPRTAKILADKGAEVVASDTFFVKGMEGPIVDGEIERCQKWALEIITK